MTTKKFDIIVVGGGPGGYVAAIRASQLGFNTAVIEREHLGGICLNWGCIPTKALLKASDLYHQMSRLSEFGIEMKGEVSFDIDKVIQRSRGVAKQLSQGIGHLLKKNKVTVIEGSAKLAGKGKLTVGKETYSADHIILATGARARTLPGLEPDGKRIWTYKQAMTPPYMPKKLLVIGSGAIGIEFASFYNDMGSDVTVVEAMDRILPVEDEEISAFAEKQFKKQGMTILKGNRDGAKLAADTKQFDAVILAVGITANTDNLGLENTKVKLDRGHIVTDPYGKTDEPGVYAIGDMAGAPWLAHKASHEGVICVEKIKGLNDVHPMKKENIPGCTYCRPQVASVGLTETKAKEAGYDIKVGRFPFIGNGKAIALGEAEGMIKTIFDAKTGELLGAHMIGAEVTELIQGYVVAKTNELTEAELMHTVFAHPTLSEMMHESVLDAYGKALHI